MKFLRLLLAAVSALPALMSAASPAEMPKPTPGPADVWDLTLLYADDAAWRTAKEQLAAEIPKLKEYEGKLGESPANLLAAMNHLQRIRDEFTRLSVYASLNLDEDTRKAPMLERTQEVGLLGTQFSRATSYMDPELLTVGEAKVKAFIAAEPGLAPHRFH